MLRHSCLRTGSFSQLAGLRECNLETGCQKRHDNVKFDDSVGEDFAYYEVVTQVFPSMGLNAASEHLCLPSREICAY